MRKFFYLMLAAFSIGTMASAQNQGSRSIEYPQRVITNGFWDNWFVGTTVGTNVYTGNHDQHISFGKRLAPALNAYVGKWFTPGLGARATYSGLYWKGAAVSPATDYVRDVLGDGYYKQRGHFVNMHADVLLNISEMFCGHNLKRTYSFIPYAGAGLIHSTSVPHNDEVSLHAGIINRFRATDRLGVNVELSTTLFKNKFDGEIGGKKIDGMTNLMVGVSYHIGKNGFDRNIIKYTGVAQADLDNANELVNNLRGENIRLSEELKKQKDANQKPVVETKSETIMAPVYVMFELGKSNLSKAQRINLQYAAASIKMCPDKVFLLEGYADNATGSVETNKRLSAERTAAVKNCLVDEFGVPANQLRIEIKGGVDNMFYNDPALSRAVIIK